MNEYFYKKDNKLFCNELEVENLAKEYGTPLYIYSHEALSNKYQLYKDAFADIDNLVCYSVKSNSNLTILKELAKLGSGMDIVSGGELFRALKAGVSANKIVYAGVGKRNDEIEYALKSGILQFNIESIPELYAINEIAKSLNLTAPIAFRINPDIDAKTHAFTTTAKKENKFGLPIIDAERIYAEANALPNINVIGMDVHLGSPILGLEPYTTAIEKLIPLVQNLKNSGIHIKSLDMGGGPGIIYKDEKPFSAKELASVLIEPLKKEGLSLILEPGRSISGNSGILVTEITYIKKTEVKTFYITDTGMNDLIRPPFYDSFHLIEPVIDSSTEKELVDVVGPICESSDYMAQNREINKCKQNDLLAIYSAGAYGFTMASNYNSRPKVAEIMLKDKKASVIRKRETYEDLIRGEE